jgi:hypothetical protein
MALLRGRKGGREGGREEELRALEILYGVSLGVSEGGLLPSSSSREMMDPEGPREEGSKKGGREKGREGASERGREAGPWTWAPAGGA